MNRDTGPIVSSAHLVSEKSAELSEFEFGLMIASEAFNRWVVRCMTDSDRSLRQAIAIAPTAASAGMRRRTSGGRVWVAFQRDRAAATSLFFLLFVILATLAAPWISPSDPYDAVNSLRNAPPGTPGFLLGADSDGRDVLSRLIWGGRISLTVGVVPSVSAMLISLLLGTITGYFGGWVDHIVMRVLDVFFAFPLVLLAIAIAGAFEPGLVTEILAIMATGTRRTRSRWHGWRARSASRKSPSATRSVR